MHGAVVTAKRLTCFPGQVAPPANSRRPQPRSCGFSCHSARFSAEAKLTQSKYGNSKAPFNYKWQGSVKNLNVVVREWDGGIVFVRRIQEGATDRSYGIHVAQLAGVPEAVVERAKAVLAGMEAKHRDLGRDVKFGGADDGPRVRAVQIPLFSLDPDPVVEELRKVDVERLTPIEALNTLARLRGLLGRGP